MAERRRHPSRASTTASAARTSARSGSASPHRPRRTATVATSTRPGTGRSASAHRSLRPGAGRQARRRARRRARRYKAPLRIPLASAPSRFRVVLIALAIALSLCAGRLLQLQGLDSSAYAATAAEQLTRTLPLLPSRGDITDRNGRVLASTQAAVAVTADPKLTSPNALEIAGVISSYLEMTPGELLPILTKPNTRFTYVKKKVPALVYSAMSADLGARRLPGIFRESDPIRTYPAGTLAAGVVGFVGADGRGLGGLELAMNAELAGVEGREVYQSSPNGSKIPLGDTTTTPAQNGLNLQTTIDSELQWVAERRLKERIRKARADWGVAVTLNVKTGEVLGLANIPTFDSARPTKADKEDRGNRAISAPYEPGSVQKLLTTAALMDSKTTVGGQPITPDTPVLIPPRLRSGPRYIKDHFPHGELRRLMRGVVAESSNIGTVLLARQMPKATLHRYLTRFGLGRPTGVELPGESAGILPDPDMRDLTRDQVAFGQGLAVTALQEASAIAGLINQGRYHPPTVIKRATSSDGREVALPRAPARQVVSRQTSAQVRDLMRAVVDSENGRRNLGVSGYQTAGKTGTAQRANPKCGCYRGYITSYVSVAPADDPEILTYVVVSNPRKGNTGTEVAAPAVQDIMQFALPRYSVEPNPKRREPQPIKWEDE